jgi:hypothetical protein
VYAFNNNDPVNNIDPNGLEPRQLDFLTSPRCMVCHGTGVSDGTVRVRDLSAGQQLAIMRWTGTSGAIDAEQAVTALRHNSAVAFSTELNRQLFATEVDAAKLAGGAITGIKNAPAKSLKFLLIDGGNAVGLVSDSTAARESDVREYAQGQYSKDRTPFLDDASDAKDFMHRALVGDEQSLRQFAFTLISSGTVLSKGRGPAAVRVSGVSSADYTPVGKYGGRVLTSRQLDALESSLSKRGIDLIRDAPPEMLPGGNAAFTPSLPRTGRPTMLLKSEATTAQVTHEWLHSLDYLDNPGGYLSRARVVREQIVFDRMAKPGVWRMLNPAERQHYIWAIEDYYGGTARGMTTETGK